ncbi:hypothetical protein L1987_65261 [Smallanthus sonchifolius]|uniref:Uncharacterized protein n=1 Tax=Smallanthus sonchifolius TaxID=185202 RepID=A0ACB9BTW3_9ASTR|nr:hypothetical protein L1987_65261 [Smallanthus sonchifolius]
MKIEKTKVLRFGRLGPICLNSANVIADLGGGCSVNATMYPPPLISQGSKHETLQHQQMEPNAAPNANPEIRHQNDIPILTPPTKQPAPSGKSNVPLSCIWRTDTGVTSDGRSDVVEFFLDFLDVTFLDPRKAKKIKNMS